MRFFIPNPQHIFVLIFYFFVSLPTVVDASRCTLCGNQIIPKEAMGIFLDNNDGDNTEEDDTAISSCQQLFDRLNFESIMEFSDECRHIQLAAFQIGCCGSNESFVPRSSCAICPDLSPFDPTIPVPHAKSPNALTRNGDDTTTTTTTMSDTNSNTQQPQTLTCGDLPDLPSFLDYFTKPGDCSDTYLQRSAGWCGCPGREIECSICPDGSDMPDPTKTEKVLYGWDCSTFEYVTALLSWEECPRSSQILEFDASAFCCPHIVDKPNVCEFCPSTQHISTRSKEVITDYGMLTCGDIADSLSLIPTTESCDFARSKFNSDLCCEYILPSSQSSSSTSNKNEGGRGRNKSSSSSGSGPITITASTMIQPMTIGLLALSAFLL